jgi:hypothetical protein
MTSRLGQRNALSHRKTTDRANWRTHWGGCRCWHGAGASTPPVLNHMLPDKISLTHKGHYTQKLPFHTTANFYGCWFRHKGKI